MFSQSLVAQLLRLAVLLSLTLVAVHHSEALMHLFAGQAMDSGCHQHFEHDSVQAAEHHQQGPEKHDLHEHHSHDYHHQHTESK